MVEPMMASTPDWLDVSRETVGALQHFGDLVSQWTARINLVSTSSLPDLWNRHILDSAQLVLLAQKSAVWADLGSGGGFPGVVLAILAREKHPDARFNFVESDQRKCAFLRKAVTELGVNAQVHAVRAEILPGLGAQTVTARALAPLSVLLDHVHRHLAPNGRAILPKGARAQDEIEAARMHWSFDLNLSPSRTDPDAQILLIENLKHV